MISSELPEVLGVADRILVMREGRLVAELSRDDADEASVMRAATGTASTVGGADQPGTVGGADQNGSAAVVGA